MSATASAADETTLSMSRTVVRVTPAGTAEGEVPGSPVHYARDHDRLAEGASARRDRQGRHRQVDGRRRAGAGAGDPAARTSCSARSRAARASRGCSTSTRCRSRSAASPPVCPDPTAPPASSTPCTSTPSRRCWSTSPSTTSSAAPAARSTVRRHRVRHHDRPRRARRAAHRQGLRGRAAQQPQQGRDPVRRRRARRAADRSHRAVPQRQQRARRPGQGRAGQVAVRHDDDAVPLAAHRRAPGHRAGGDAGAGDRRRHRRAARRRPARRRRRRQPGAPPGPHPRAAHRRRARGRSPPTCGRAGVEADPALVDSLVTEGREHAERRALETSQRALVADLDVPTYELPRLPQGVDLGALYELAASLREQGLA